MEEEPHAEVDDEGVAPRGGCSCGSAFHHQGGEGVPEGGAEREDGGERGSHDAPEGKRKTVRTGPDGLRGEFRTD